MKRLNDDGAEEVISQTQFGRLPNDRPFPPYHFDPALIPEHDIDVEIELADLHTYTYRYGVFPDDVDTGTLSDILNHVPPDGYKGLTGGKFYNASIRPRLLRKIP